ncbi:MAG: hypothetical protein LQ344_004318 [Seirophora lacunosa]|nr:MAG: hypothetical protein LQ344_004318 [Seirophora lacunosa]
MAFSVIRYTSTLLHSVLYILSISLLLDQFALRVVEASPRPRLHVRQSSSDTDPPCTGFFDSEYNYFAAEDAYDCLASAPFDRGTALEFIDYYIDTLQLQSTQAYLKDPPPEYQQPPVDLFGRLANLKDQVEAGQFKSEYDFEAAVQKLILATHDAHINLAYGILSIFTFGSPYGLVSVSTDDDLLEAQYDEADWTPSAVVEINNIEASKFLKDFAAANVQGYIEPHADWNNLMSSAASDVQFILSTFEGSSILYPGASIRFKFENGTDSGDLPWLAQFSMFAEPSDAPLITTGEELYNWYVWGVDATPDEYSSATTSLPPTTTSTVVAAVNTSTASNASSTSDVSALSTYAGDTADSTATAAATSTVDDGPASVTGWDNIAYPTDPIVAQPDLAEVNGGVLTGYILNDNVTAVLSIPSFLVNSENAVSFSTTVQDFLIRSKAAGCTQVIIDVQRNTGGSDLLATDTFKQFFPSIDPYGAARYYDTHTQAEMEDPENDFDYFSLSANAWVVTDYLNAETGRNFSSWPEFFGPHAQHGDLFTTVQRDNLSSPIFTEAAAGLVVYGYANRTINTTQPFAAEDVIILSDAWCSSACARFVEMMRHEGGARTVVAGGQPVTGPMQTVGGSKGAQSYDGFSLDNDIDVAVQFNNSVQDQLPRGRDDVDFIYTYAGFNLKDSIRKGEDTPLQFVYEPADCRIFYTHNTVYNYMNLWNYVIDAVYRNPSLCVAGSAKPPLGALIMKGFSYPSAQKQKEKKKRSLTPSRLARKRNKRAKPFSIPNPDALSTAKNDRPFELPQCKKCKGGDVCFEAPQCRQGALSVAPTCATKCAIGGGGPTCRDPRHSICRTEPGKRTGVCISQVVNDAERDCRSGTGRRIQQASVPNPALGNFEHSPGVARPGRRG